MVGRVGAHDLPHPDPAGGWQRDIHGGWCCHVEQRWYGHRARKATWLYAVGCELPSLRWGAAEPGVWLSWCANHNRGQVVERMAKRERSATPLEFRDVLLAMASSVAPRKEAA